MWDPGDKVSFSGEETVHIIKKEWSNDRWHKVMWCNRLGYFATLDPDETGPLCDRCATAQGNAHRSDLFVTAEGLTYRWEGKGRLRVGDRVLLPGTVVTDGQPYRSTVKKLSSSYTGRIVAALGKV